MDLIPIPDRQAIRSVRSAKPIRSPYQAQGYLLEREPLEGGRTAACATYFLTGSECRFTCSFCDLWKYTINTQTPIGSLARQIESLHHILQSQGERFDWLKLYNASNFFDPYNVPIEDHAGIASACESASRLVVENHAKLTSSTQGLRWIRSFQQMLRPKLEIAMGLESIDPDAERLMNKLMRRSDFEAACDRLRECGIAVRVFVILQPPGTEPGKALDWCVKTCKYAFERGAERCSIIPARQGNGWIDRLEEQRLWAPPTLPLVESTLRAALENLSATGRIVSVDMWDWESLKGGCDRCRKILYDTMVEMNFEQRAIPREACPFCEPAENS
ncbi:MAG: hypothetical protein KGQ51_02705 [Planctomycetes bacterium]|nr:hypothetical protein [Planctomycetota bacterium]